MQFDTAKEGRIIVVPVTFEGEKYKFLVDTGAAITTFDAILENKLGDATGEAQLGVFGGSIKTKEFQSPNAFVGSESLSSLESVVIWDLGAMRAATGVDFYGILGMDFLSKYAIEIDFDNGLFSLYYTAPTEWLQNSASVKLGRKNGCLCLPILVGNNLTEEFTIDTGANASTLRSEVFDRLLASKQIIPSREVMVAGAGGFFQTRIGLVTALTLAEFRTTNTRVDRDDESLLGLWYLARYHWRIDGPGNTAYIHKGKRFAKHEPTATSGLSIFLKNRAMVIVRVDADSPAELAGLKLGDIVEQINDELATTIDTHKLREILTDKEGKIVKLKVRRENKVFETQVTLASRFADSATENLLHR